jgi:hypothetical protein
MLHQLSRWIHAWNVDRRIRRHGWAGIHVGDYEGGLAWTYSVGFDEALAQHEVIVFDVPKDVANALLWHAFEALKAGNLAFEDGAPVEALGGAVWRRVHPSQIDNEDAWLGGAARRRERRTGSARGLQAYQIVLPGNDGLMPWDEGYDERLRMKQPALYLPAEDYGGRPTSQLEREALRLVRERGWAIVRIRGELNWAYTMGFADAGLPELLCFLPSADGAADLLHDTRGFLERSELVLTDGSKWNGLGVECCWRRVHPSHVQASNVLLLMKQRVERLTGGREFPETYQLFLPDRNGKYPWDHGCDRSVAAVQPMLFEPFHPRS